jgi:hypothetical protein
MKNDNLDIRRLSVLEENLEQWNLCALLATHPHYNNTDKVVRVSATYIALTFATEEKRNLFSDTLEKLLIVRAKQEQTLKASVQNARSWDNRISHAVMSEK